MNTLKLLLNEILELTNTIEKDYPELYRFLDENPISIPVESKPEIDKKVMLEYLASLKELLKHYKESQKVK